MAFLTYIQNWDMYSIADFGNSNCPSYCASFTYFTGKKKTQYKLLSEGVEKLRLITLLLNNSLIKKR